MIRKIIKIDEKLCNGCGLCASACHEGAIGIVDGKAQLLRDNYCDGLGDCLPVCPTGAITFEEREAAPYDEAAVKANIQRDSDACGCPGTQSKILSPQEKQEPLACGCAGTHVTSIDRRDVACESAAPDSAAVQSQLSQWPVQIQLVPANAPYFDGAQLLVAADCAAYAYGNFHHDFIKNHVTLIGCPKLDETDYAQKLTDILQQNNIKSVTVVRMEVPCCGGLEHAVIQALRDSGKMIPWQVITITTDGNRLD